MKFATLVYQAGIANVFEYNSFRFNRLIQSDFKTCEAFCDGLKAAGVRITTAWCNQAGDIQDSSWNFDNFEDAPWNEKFKIY